MSKIPLFLLALFLSVHGSSIRLDTVSPDPSSDPTTPGNCTETPAVSSTTLSDDTPTDETSDPTSTTDPIDALDPTNSTDPTDSTEPEDPTDSTEPEDSTNSTEPEDPTNSTEPTEPVAIVCPSYDCSPMPDALCVTPTATGWKISECMHDFDCKFSLADMATGTCVLEVSSDSDETCYDFYIASGLACGPLDYCDPSSFCNTTSSTCAVRTPLGANCSDIYECATDSVCNMGVCVPHFSVVDGGTSNSSYACASGIVADSVCQSTQVTNGTMPKACVYNEDCLASDGVTAGVCECGLGAVGTAFCRPHRSDSVSLKHLAKVYNGNYDEITYFTYKISYYTIVALTNTWMEDGCWKDSDELRAFDILEDYLEMCSPECAVTGCIDELGY